MTTLVASIVTTIVGAVIGGGATYFTARRDLQLKFDASLRDLRIDAYKVLWQKLEKLAKYGRPEPLSKGEAQQLRGELATWYFHTGGLVLSTETRRDYFRLLDGLEVVIAGSGNILADEDDEFLRVLGSRLRTAMTRDVGTRRTYIFRGDEEREPIRLESRTFVDEHGATRLELTPRRRLKVARRLRLRTTLFAEEPELALSDDATPLGWDGARRELTVRIAAEGQPSEERLFVFDDGRIIEGPHGWHRGDDASRRASRIWKRDG